MMQSRLFLVLLFRVVLDASVFQISLIDTNCQFNLLQLALCLWHVVPLVLLTQVVGVRISVSCN